MSTAPHIHHSVEECLRMCGLEAYAEASVGSLNVEFKKRTTIAVELAAKVCVSFGKMCDLMNASIQPKLLLFLDEPTSGLDSQSAWAIMKFLRTLADNGQAILCTYVMESSLLLTFSHRSHPTGSINLLQNYFRSVSAFYRQHFAAGPWTNQMKI